METAATHRKQERQLRGLLAVCRLLQWHPVLRELLAHYDGLADVVSSPRDAPRGALLHELRHIAQTSGQPSDALFAQRIAQLPFLSYRVLSVERQRPTRCTWDPCAQPLAAFRRSAQAITAYPSPDPVLPPPVVERRLLTAVRRQRYAS